VVLAPDGELIEVKGSQLRGDLIWRAPRFASAALRGDRVLLLVVEARVEKRA